MPKEQWQDGKKCHGGNTRVAVVARGGRKRLRGVKYSSAADVVTPAAAWTATTEAVVTVPQLARVIRALDSAIQVPQQSPNRLNAFIVSPTILFDPCWTIIRHFEQ